MGGVQPSYTNIERRMLAEPGSYVAATRMPTGIDTLQDMRTWVRAQADAWVTHILDGQLGRIPRSQRFAWRIIPRPTSEKDRVVENPEFKAVEGSVLRWTADELLFKERMDLEAQGESSRTDISKRLPLARTTHIYAPYSVDLFHSLKTIHAEEDDLLDLLVEVAKMEEFGPIHVRV